MSFDEKYLQIQNTVKDDLIKLENDLKSVMFIENPLSQKLSDIIFAPSKRLRPLVTFLFLRAAGEDVTDRQLKIISAIELIHNASLIHDDVIDNCDLRRNQQTINAEFDNSLAVISGDFLLSLALKNITSVQSSEILDLFASTLENMCVGEINQYFDKYKIPSIEEYIEKSRRKTAFLFETAIQASLLAGNQKYIEAGSGFAQNFGIAFQIRDDLLNFISTGELKPAKNDISSGIYTAPVIFSGDLNNASPGIEKTRDLMDNYFVQAIRSVDDLKESKYKTALTELAELFKNEIQKN